MLRSAIAAQEGRKQWYLLDRTPLALAREIVSTTKVNTSIDFHDNYM